MTGRVIQGHFAGGRARAPGPPVPPNPLAPRIAPPAHAGAARPPVAQRQGGGNFAIDPAHLGLVRGGGRPLPETVRSKMEAAFGADFTAVRVHVGPQAERIGAVAFTTGTDIYFAPGRYQPDTPAGQQLLGHELAHVIQQRQGRVRGPGGGVAVVQDRALEAEANAAGLRVAAHALPPPRGPSPPAPGGHGQAGSALQRQVAGRGPVGAVQAARPVRAPVAPPPVVWSRPVQQRAANVGTIGNHAHAQTVVQRNVKVGNVEYKARGRNGQNPSGLVADMDAERRRQKFSLRRGWQTAVKDLAKDKSTVHTFTDWDAILKAYKSQSSTDKTKRKREAQDQVITNLHTGITEPAKKRARTMAYESKRAMDSIISHIEGRAEFAGTVGELEALTPRLPPPNNEITQTTNPAVVLVGLNNSTMHRLDFNFQGVPIVSHGYESPGNRAVDAVTLNAFGYGPIKIGDDVGSYSQALKRGTDIRGPEHRTLIPLEMLRIPPVSTALAIKRDLYEQNQILLSEAISQSNVVSNVEFVGAVNGASMTADQKRHLRQQQVWSNHSTIDTYATRFPNHAIGTDLGDGKVRTTPRQINQNLDRLIAAGTGTKKARKKELRKSLRRANASVMGLNQYDSDSDVSDYDEDDYKNYERKF